MVFDAEYLRGNGIVAGDVGRQSFLRVDNVPHVICADDLLQHQHQTLVAIEIQRERCFEGHASGLIGGEREAFVTADDAMIWPARRVKQRQ